LKQRGIWLEPTKDWVFGQEKPINLDNPR